MGLASGPVWLVAGLGNPGDRYANTRHNAGARAVGLLAADLGLKLRPAKTKALVAKSVVGGVQLVLSCPLSFMNESGRPVAALLKYFKVDPENLIIVHDDIDLLTADIRVKFGGGSAGNHGVDSVVDVVGTKDFHRVRIGVGRPSSPRVDPADYVLEPLSKKSLEELADAEARAAHAVLSIIHT